MSSFSSLLLSHLESLGVPKTCIWEMGIEGGGGAVSSLMGKLRSGQTRDPGPWEQQRLRGSPPPSSPD